MDCDKRLQLSIGKKFIIFIITQAHIMQPVSSSSVCFIFAMTHLLRNSEFASKYEYHLAFASGSLLFIAESLVGGRLVIINKVALLTLEIVASTCAFTRICSSWSH